MSFNAEHAVLGAVMKKPTLVAEMDLLAEDFETQSYAIAYQAVLDMVAANDVVDIITVAERLNKSHPNMKALSVIGQAAKDCPTVVNAVAYAHIVKKDARNKKAKEVAVELLNTIDHAENSLQVVDQAVRGLMALAQTQKQYDSSIGQALQKAIINIEAAYESEDIVGIPMGLKRLDAILSGLHNSDLTIIGARPAMGKTAFMLNLANNAKQPVGIISAEQPNEQMGMRLIAIHGRVNANHMRTGKMTEEDFTKVSNTVATLHQQSNLWLYDKPAPSIMDVVRQARVWKHLHNIKALYVDYIQRIKWTDQNIPKHEQVGNVVMALKELARELDIPVVALAQVNREVEKRSNKRPRMGDLKDSGVIEQEADCIMLLYRDEVYNENTDQKGLMEIDVQKNRHGPIGFVCCYWLEEYMKVSDEK